MRLEGFCCIMRDDAEWSRRQRIVEREREMRILLADNRSKVRFALRVLLERQPGLAVVGEATNANDLLAQAKATHPDLVLLGWELPGLVGIDLLSTLRKIRPELEVIALSSRPEARRAALTAGANAFVSKTDLPERLLAAIDDCGGNSNIVQIERVAG